MRETKVVAGFAAAGAVLSLLLGIFAVNPFGVILLRMLLSAIGAAALGFGMLKVMGRFLPEFGSPLPEADGPGHIDIVIPEENPHIGSGDVLEAEAELDVAAPEELGTVEDLETGLPGLDVEEPGMEPVTEEPPLDPGLRPWGGPDEVPLRAGLGGLEMDPRSAIPPAGDLDLVPEGAAEPALAADGFGSLDTPGADAGDVRIPRARGTEGTAQDPALVARALRTMMKREQEG